MKTRVTFVDFEIYSANLDIWLTSRTIFEWLPSGVVIGKILYPTDLFAAAFRRRHR
jgi:hypothetical protein